MVVALVGGGARSGKSRFALELAEARFARPALIATAQAFDPEMTARIERHRAARSSRWHTIEEPFAIVEVMERERGRYDGFLIDCLTLWLTNVLLRDARTASREIEALIDVLGDNALKSDSLENAPPVIFVTNEVGCGIVPENALAREFRDLAGTLNQRMASIAREVYWMAFGIPMRIKPSTHMIPS
jgi:adenosylcobinamide kinase / adenosylcobinamide-phosphate guanylyltransferase